MEENCEKKSHYPALHMKARCSFLGSYMLSEDLCTIYVFWEELRFQHGQDSPHNPHSFQVVCITFTHTCTVWCCMKYVLYVSFMILWSVFSEAVKQMWHTSHSDVIFSLLRLEFCVLFQTLSVAVLFTVTLHISHLCYSYTNSWFSRFYLQTVEHVPSHVKCLRCVGMWLTVFKTI